MDEFDLKHQKLNPIREKKNEIKKIKNTLTFLNTIQNLALEI